jgi:hypothetical protein|tara:strand:+ start:41 stop:670 length:630 start_codon:yes stop_codon:yes gene_type:complete
MPTITKLTEDYIQEYKSIKDCLKKGIINYSALSRLIGKDLGIEKKAKKEAILIAARRYKEKIKGKTLENDIIGLFRKSNLEIKNNMVIFTLEKSIYPDSLIEIEKTIKKEKELFFSIEGKKTLTIIVQKQHMNMVEKRFKNYIIAKKENLSLITLSSPGIDKIPGAVNYITGFFFENEINIEEFMSCHEDTLIVVDSGKINKVMDFLSF